MVPSSLGWRNVLPCSSSGSSHLKVMGWPSLSTVGWPFSSVTTTYSGEISSVAVALVLAVGAVSTVGISSSTVSTIGVAVGAGAVETVGTSSSTVSTIGAM